MVTRSRLTFGEKVKAVFALIVIVGFLAFVVWITVICFGPSDSTEHDSSSRPTPDQLKDVKYLDEHYAAIADEACADGADDYLRSAAKYDFAWDHIGTFETKFDQNWMVLKQPGVLTVVSDKAKLQNGFGAFMHVELFCDYDTQAQEVRGYSITLPNDNN